MMSVLKYSRKTILFTVLTAMILSMTACGKIPGKDAAQSSAASSSAVSVSETVVPEETKKPSAAETPAPTEAPLPAESNETSDTKEEPSATEEPEAKPEETGSTSEEKAEEPEEITVESGVSNFSFVCNSPCSYIEKEDGQVDVRLLTEEGDYPLLSVKRIMDGRTAKEALTDEIASLKEEFGAEPKSPEADEIQERDLFKSSAKFVRGQEEMGYSGYSEEYEDGSVVCYRIIYPSDTAKAAKKALKKAFKTMWVGELEMTAPEETPEAKPSEKITAGRWTFTQTLLPNGNIEFCFDDTLIMEVPGSWKDTAIWGADGKFFSFYHKGSYKKMKEEGLTGGLLFSLLYYSDTSYESLPSYDYIGLAEGGHYVMAFPTDVQGYMDDPDVWAEWQKMYEEVEYIRLHVYSMKFS